jgi:uncharacterized protein (DUF305 family)
MMEPSTLDTTPSNSRSGVLPRSVGQWALLVAALLIGAAAAWVAGWSPQEGSADVRFARDMAAHHAQAVELAQIVRERSQDAELRQFALDIILTQQAQIGQMQGWLAVWGRPLSGLEAPMSGMGEMMGMATPEQVASLHTLPVEEAEVTFLQLMIRHHQGGVMMAEDTLKQTRQPPVIRLATAIVAGQQSEIDTMRQFLTQRGAPLPPDLAPHEGHM